MVELVKDICQNLPHGTIGVVGDFCTDVYWDMQPQLGERSIETGKMTIPVSPARYSPGGAGNIVANLRGIGVKNIHCFGPVGKDPFGIWLARAMQDENCSSLTEIQREDYHTPVYCKPLADGVEQSRFDLGNISLTDDESDIILDSLRRTLPQLKVLIINEQLSCGVHSEYFRKNFSELVRKFAGKVQFVFDGRDHLNAYTPVTLKINTSAASRLAFGKEGYSAEDSGRKILAASSVPLTVTDGENGCYVFESGKTVHIPAIRYSGAIDTVGAGDSFTAGFSCALACGKNMCEAAKFGTCCSGVTIRKINQTGVPVPQELLQVAAE